MAIQINTVKLAAWQNDLADQIKVEMLNEVAVQFASEVKKALENAKCQKHPDQISYVTIVPHRKKNMIIKTKFCCPEFDKKMSVKIER